MGITYLIQVAERKRRLVEKPLQADREYNVAAKFIWLALYSYLIISNLKLPNKFGVYEKRIHGQPV